MAIEPTCDKCGDVLTDFGGILLSPPDQENKVVKYHLCKTCYQQIRKTLNTPDT